MGWNPEIGGNISVFCVELYAPEGGKPSAIIRTSYDLDLGRVL